MTKEEEKQEWLNRFIKVHPPCIPYKSISINKYYGCSPIVMRAVLQWEAFDLFKIFKEKHKMNEKIEIGDFEDYIDSNDNKHINFINSLDEIQKRILLDMLNDLAA